MLKFHPDLTALRKLRIFFWWKLEARANLIKYSYCLELESQPFINRCLVISNHFPCKDLVHHPIETTIYKWLALEFQVKITYTTSFGVRLHMFYISYLCLVNLINLTKFNLGERKFHQQNDCKPVQAPCVPRPHQHLFSSRHAPTWHFSAKHPANTRNRN